MKETPINDRTVLQPISNSEVDVIQDDGTDIPERVRLDREAAIILRDALGIWLCAGAEASPKEDKVAVMLGDTTPPTLILGMSKAAWDYCSDGKTHTFDLSNFGIPLQIMIAGGLTRESVIGDVERGLAAVGGTFERHPGAEDRDLGIKPPAKQ